ncbi:MAG: methionyl-tRNA formyltransferase, partial [Candidatus Nealsonbacteria bacterium]|nr:methionyl-tRNA formyltransferase [Candidatus Nealsonbacteria bacterium]
MKIIFAGTPEFGAVVLEKLIKDGFPPILVITETDKPVGRKKIITPPPVKVTAQNYK